MPMLPTKTLLRWTFGRGTVVSKLLHLLGTVVEALGKIWRIWPAVLLHTVFAAGT